jgi:hypothetical protein
VNGIRLRVERAADLDLSVGQVAAEVLVVQFVDLLAFLQDEAAAPSAEQTRAQRRRDYGFWP